VAAERAARPAAEPLPAPRESSREPEPARPSGEALAPPRSAGEMLARAREWLARHAPEEARLEAELLVAHALGLKRLELFLALDRPLAAGELERARELLRRRAQRVPVAYLTGTREFYGREFAVGPAVLIPRPETELIVDLARSWWRERGAPAGARAADFGTGSGCLAISLALECAGLEVCASDVSAEALECARANAQRLGARVELRLGDGLSALEQPQSEGYDLLVSNPPYVEPERAHELAPELRHEPALALYAPVGAPDTWAERLLRFAARRLRPGGVLLVELGLGQAERLRDCAARLGLAREPRFERDAARIERVLVWRAD